MFSVSLRDVLNAKLAFDKLTQLPLSLKVNRRVGLILEQLNKEYERFESLRNGLIKEIGVKGEGDSYSIPEEERAHFMEEVNELIGEMVVFNCEKLEEEALPDSLAITPIEYTAFKEFLMTAD